VQLPAGGGTRAGAFQTVVGALVVAGRVLPVVPTLGLSSPWDDPGVRSSEDTGMPTGTIARLLIDKGFGFIRDESGIEHFFHRSSVRQAVFELLREGQRVEFTPEESGKGPRAGEVRLIEG
jgi:cold shock protein